MSSQRYEKVCLLWPLDPLCHDNIFKTSVRSFSNLLQISTGNHDDSAMTPSSPQNHQPSPASPPPSFRSRTSSPSSRRLLASEDPIATDAQRTLHDTFDDGSDSDGEGSAGDDRQGLIRSNITPSMTESRSIHEGHRPIAQTIPTPLSSLNAAPNSANVPARPYAGAHPFSSFSHSNDGVFANLNAKPERGEKTEEQLPVSNVIVLLDMTMTDIL